MNSSGPSLPYGAPPSSDPVKGIYFIAVSQFGIAFSFNCIMSFMPFYILKVSAYEMKETMLWIGMIMGATSLVAALAAPFWGSLTARVRPKLLFEGGIFCNGVIFRRSWAASTSPRAPGRRPVRCAVSAICSRRTSRTATSASRPTRESSVTLNQRIGGEWNWFFNAAWQDTPEFEGLSDAEVASQNIAPEWRANAGLSFDNGPFFWSANVIYQDEAYWADVLNYKGYNDAFTQVNAAIGFRVLDERMSIQVIGSNLFDEEIQQHIFGDIISRKLTGQIGFRF